jgi:hypothetical protein
MSRPSYLILHGYQGSGPGHWQAWLAGRLQATDALVRFPDLVPATKLILEHEPAFTLAFVRGVTPRFVELVGDALEPAADHIPAITAAGLTVAELAEIFVRTTSSSYFLPGEHTGEISLWLQRLSGATQALESP